MYFVSVIDTGIVSLSGSFWRDKLDTLVNFPLRCVYFGTGSVKTKSRSYKTYILLRCSSCYVAIECQW